MLSYALVLTLPVLSALSVPARATALTRRCAALLGDRHPDFDRDLTPRAEHCRVHYKRRTFRVRPAEYLMLQMIVDAPEETATYDELANALWDAPNPEKARTSITVMVSVLRKMLREADPNFDKLKTRNKVGLYWHRERYQMTTMGRVGVANFIHEAYVDGRPIKLTRGEHAILLKLLSEHRVYARDIADLKSSSVPITVCTLNQKIEVILGLRPIFHDGINAYRLDRSGIAIRNGQAEGVN